MNLKDSIDWKIKEKVVQSKEQIIKIQKLQIKTIIEKEKEESFNKIFLKTLKRRIQKCNQKASRFNFVNKEID